MAQRATDVAKPPRTRLTAEARKRQLAEVAAEQFQRLGFRGVSVADLANEVGVTAPAIYRHFQNKHELLVAAIESGLDVVEVALALTTHTQATQTLATQTEDSLAELLSKLAAAAIARRDLWVLLQREARHLDAEQRAGIDRRFAAIVAQVSAAIHRARPDAAAADLPLLTTAALAVLASPALYQRRVAAKAQIRVLAAAAEAACRAEWTQRAPRAALAPQPAPPAAAASRSEELLTTAIRLFAERGYTAVSLDDIGAAIGIAGPSIYYHYATKADLLVSALTRATDWLTARRSGATPPVLNDLVDAYVDVGVREHLLLGVYVLEIINLPPEAGRRIRAGLDADVQAWCAALGRERPELSETEQLMLVQAARGVVHDVMRIGHLHDRPRIATELRALMHAVLTASLA